MDNNKKKKIEQAKEEGKIILPTFEHLHKMVNRRDFLAAGVIPFSASMIMPSWLNIFANAGVAEAQELSCKAAGTGTLCPYIGLKLSGGAGLAMNFVPHDKGLQPLNSYSLMGLGKNAISILNQDFANLAPFWTTAGGQTSGVLTGIRAQAQPTTLSKTAMVGVCFRSQDDSSTNKLDPSGMVGKAGLAGSILPNMGRSNTETGFNALSAIVKPDAPLIVSRFEDIAGSLGVTGALANLLPPEKEKLFGVVKRSVASQAGGIRSLSGGATLAKLAECASIGNEALVKNANNLNISPLSDAAFAANWGITAATSTSAQNFVFASLVWNALNKNAGTVNLDMGGYDYHDGTRTSGDARDQAAGAVIGMILESFAIRGTDGFLTVFSDGSVSSADSESPTAPWMSDRGTAGMAYMFHYKHQGVAKAKSFQLGSFTQGQVADDTNLIGGTTEKAAAAIFANYLAANDQLGKFESIVPRVFSTDELEKIRILGGS